MNPYAVSMCFATHENPGGWLMSTLKNKLKENERMRRRDLSVCFPGRRLSG